MSNVSLLPLPLGTYEDVAAEYYDAERHPTCANFAVASRRVILSLLETVGLHRLLHDRAMLVDVGAGKSVLADILTSMRISLESTVAIDKSYSMLSHSAQYAEAGLRMVVADARQLPIENDTFEVGVASLADPFNYRAAWGEAERVLVRGGYWIVTFPSFEWAQTFRRSARNEQHGSAYFITHDGAACYLPSIVLDAVSQRRLFESVGLQVVARVGISRRELTGRVSQKLDLVGAGEPVVVGYALRKQ